MPVKPESIKVPILAELINCGDGTYRLRPTVPGHDMDQWISIAQAAQILGVKPQTIYPWLGKYLVHRKPSQSRVLVSLRSVMDLRRATDHPEFWESGELQGRVAGAVAARLAAFAGQ